MSEGRLRSRGGGVRAVGGGDVDVAAAQPCVSVLVIGQPVTKRSRTRDVGEVHENGRTVTGATCVASLGWAVRWGIPNAPQAPMATPSVHNSDPVAVRW
jgi:hypothetical protein